MKKAIFILLHIALTSIFVYISGCKSYRQIICPDGRDIIVPKKIETAYKTQLTGYYWSLKSLLKKVSTSTDLNNFHKNEIKIQLETQKMIIEQHTILSILALQGLPCDKVIYNEYADYKKKLENYSLFLIEIDEFQQETTFFKIKNMFSQEFTTIKRQ